jgi:UDP-N-acetylglucosamine transferase subunit ALG13
MNDYPFGPLFERMDAYAERSGKEVVQQVAGTGFNGSHSRCFDFLPDDGMSELYGKADLVVCHAGIGTILNCLERRIPMVLVPRTVVVRSTDGTPDGQEEVAAKVEAMGRAVVLRDLKDLEVAIEAAEKLEIPPYQRNRDLEAFLSDLLRELSEKKASGKPR